MIEMEAVNYGFVVALATRDTKTNICANCENVMIVSRMSNVWSGHFGHC